MSTNQGSLKTSVQKFGRFLSSMVMPNIGSFIAWGFITALFIADGYLPNEQLASMVDPMLKYLLPILIAYQGGKIVAGDRGAVIGAIATMGVVVGSEIPMLLGAMVMGPLAGFVIKKFDKLIEGKVKVGLEMLVNNFSVGILGMLLAIIGYYGVGPIIAFATSLVEAGVKVLVNAHLLPLVSIFIEPGKILFLNNAINHGVLSPIGMNEAKEAGKSIMFLLESNPGPGLGVLLAYALFGKGSAKQSSPGAILIHFIGGIHEIYFPYVLMNPALILAVIGGGMSGVLTMSLLNAGLVAPASPGSIIALMGMSPKGGQIPVLIGVIVATVVSFLIASIFVKRAAKNSDGEDIAQAQEKMKAMKAESKGLSSVESEDKTEASEKGSEEVKSSHKDVKDIKKIVFACDAGMGSSAMGASKFKSRIKNYKGDISISHSAVAEVPEDADIVVTHENLKDRVKNEDGKKEVITIKNFLKDENLDELFERFNKYMDQ